MFQKPATFSFFLLIAAILFGPEVASFQFVVRDYKSHDIKVRLILQPLLGGPKWLPVHCQVALSAGGVEESSHRFDMVPENPTQLETLRDLLLFRSAPAHTRHFHTPTNEPAEESQSNDIAQLLLDQANKFRSQEKWKGLNLLTNNCWSFAYELVREFDAILQEDRK